MKRFYFFFFILFSISGFSQDLKISGTVLDTVEKTPLQNAVAMTIRIKDSTLVAFARTSNEGVFLMNKLPIDTYQVIISHPKFSEQSYFIVGSEKNKEFDFGKIILSPKNMQLNEVVIFAFKDPVYYRGDTLVYTADSFKVKPNATVEDLLKKLPGISVDKEGKIKAQGKDVDQVLVDGDEFFGADPTIATKNLNATAVESVQVYEKKNENQTGEDDKETLKILDLKLKEEAKKGYFGKASAASDFSKFYEGEFLANKFKKKQKISVYSMTNNTPRSGFDWNDAYKYGLNEEMGRYDEEEGMYYGSQNSTSGIPRTIKSGIYYNDKFNDKTTINSNYAYNNAQLTENNETKTQTFLTDTNFTTQNTSANQRLSQSHRINFSISQKLDSFTRIEITPKATYGSSKSESYETNQFISVENILGRTTAISNSNKGENYDINTSIGIARKFRKEDRKINFDYTFGYSQAKSEALLKTIETVYSGTTLPTGNFDQVKNSVALSRLHEATLEYIEPLTKKVKLEFTYDFGFNLNTQDKKTFDEFNGEYTLLNTQFSNDFENVRYTNRFGTKFVYDVKKQRLVLGTRLRNISVANENFITSQIIHQSVNNVLPFVRYRYKINDNTSFGFEYTTKSRVPTINQLQPIPDNSNPNRIVLGNPNLLPTFEQKFSVSYHTFKMLTGRYYYASLDFNTLNNSINNATSFDSLGRTVTTPINIDGNYSINFYGGGQFPFFSKVLSINPELYGYYSKQINYLNNVLNTTLTQNYNTNIDIALNFEKVTFDVGANYSYNIPQSDVSTLSNKPYSTYSYEGAFSIDFPKKIKLSSDASYTFNTQRAQGFNVNVLLLNASIGKTFFKNENFIVSVNVYDILNQNINVSRYVSGNVITDSKTNIIARYFLVKAIYKFNSSKTKEEEDEF
ncbi:MAG: outer membrane beta-barrel protein [Bacteroidetes bacterium]|nr:outer membrane beta-barrel protein [Bacteroidota bacterium]